MKQEILLCDLDAFFASVEQLDNPELKGKPVVVGGDPDSRGVVSTCSYEARQYGVRSAMPMKKALGLCPEAIVLPVNMTRYKEVSEQVIEIFDRFTPDIEQVSIDEAYLAVRAGTGLEAARKIRSAAREGLGLPLSIGVSINKLLAKIACSLAKPDGIRALYPEDVEKVLWPLPVRFLPGVGPVTEQKLNTFGIKTVGELASFPLEALKSITGSPDAAAELKEYAFGRDSRKLELNAGRKSVSEEITFPQDIHEKDYILTVLFDLASEVGYRLRSKGLKARTVGLKLKFPDLSIKTRSLTLSEATASDKKIFGAATDLFIRCCGNPPWRLVGIRASGLERGSQLTLISSGDPREEKITPVLDMLRRRYGRKAVFKGRRLLLLRKNNFKL
ncbi:MAG: DNA polymerase IV [Dethiobacteria bacterium]